MLIYLCAEFHVERGKYIIVEMWKNFVENIFVPRETLFQIAFKKICFKITT